MNDRELLELAAKAAGYWLAYDGMCATGVDTPFVQWNPLIDDGDALRLAIHLNLTVSTDGEGTISVSLGRLEDADIYVTHWTRNLEDKQSATRRAIVRAAAEIGKTM